MGQQQKTILDDHRNMLMVSKKISEFQEKNLKTWPFLVFDNLESVQIDYNFIRKDKQFYAGSITYDLTFKENKLPDGDKKKQALTDLYNWTSYLFWTDTKIVFKVNGKKWT